MTGVAEAGSSDNDQSTNQSANQIPLLSIALVCQSNVNRSMEAHAILQASAFPLTIGSYGVGAKVRLPGELASTPNVYDFGTAYSIMVADLERKNRARYEKNGILPMLRRDEGVKNAPERWIGVGMPHYDIIITFEHRVFDSLTTIIEHARGVPNRTSHVINFHTPDNTKDAANAAVSVNQFIKSIVARGHEWPIYLEQDLAEFEERENRELLHRILYY
jgi:RNA polymerase II subunit A C-terminal domain phosphatase SSU72